MTFHFDSDTDTRYFSEKITSFPLEKLHELYISDEGHPIRDFTFYGEEFTNLHQQMSRSELSSVSPGSERGNE